LVHRALPAEPPEFLATASSCPHRGCPLGYSAADRLIECPCHGSRFRAVADLRDPRSCAGDVVHPPARSPLVTWKVERVGDTAFVDLRSPDACPRLPAPVDGRVILAFADFPALASPGGVAVGQPDGFVDKLLVVRLGVAAVALSALCPHRGCTVAFALADRQISCPCHGSTFNLEGGVIDGPAPRGLRNYPATVAADAIVVTVGP
jgi:Rieske Fe-S protein